MLLITRKKDEWIIIGDGLIKILIKNINGKYVKVGFEVSPDVGKVPIRRGEIYELEKERAKARSKSS